MNGTQLFCFFIVNKCNKCLQLNNRLREWSRFELELKNTLIFIISKSIQVNVAQFEMLRKAFIQMPCYVVHSVNQMYFDTHIMFEHEASILFE